MENFLDTLSKVWFLVLGFVALVSGWVRLEIKQKNGDKDMVALENLVKDEVKKMQKHSESITQLETDMKWIKGTLERMEKSINSFIVTYPRSLIDEIKR